MLRMKAFQQDARKGQPCSDLCLRTQMLSVRSAAQSSAQRCPHTCSTHLESFHGSAALLNPVAIGRAASGCEGRAGVLEPLHGVQAAWLWRQAI